MRKISKPYFLFFINWGIRLIILGALFLAIYFKEWFYAIIAFVGLLLMLVPFIFKRNYNIFIPIEIEMIYLCFIFLSIILGEIGDYYYKFWWWDLMLHTLSGILLGLTGFFILFMLISTKKLRSATSISMFFVFCFAVTLGVFWEIFEFLMDTIFGLNMQKSGLLDTMSDLIADSFGAMISSVFGYLYLKFKKNNKISYLIQKIIDINPRYFKNKKI